MSKDDVLAFADRGLDTAEDAFMHARRMFEPAAKMNLPLKAEDGEPLPATKKERLVVLGTGWGGHAISKVRRAAYSGIVEEWVRTPSS